LTTSVDVFFDGPVGARTETLGEVVSVLEKAGVGFLK
jgi:hypothetical protein